MLSHGACRLAASPLRHLNLKLTNAARLTSYLMLTRDCFSGAIPMIRRAAQATLSGGRTWPYGAHKQSEEPKHLRKVRVDLCRILTSFDADTHSRSVAGADPCERAV